MAFAFRLLGAVIVALSLVPILAGARLYRSTGRFVERAVRTDATVVEVERRDGNSYYPLFLYRDHEGNEYTKEGFGSSSPAFPEGSSRVILYDPLDPSRAKFDSFASLWLLPLLLGGIGLFPLLMGLGTALLLPLAIGSAVEHPASGSCAGAPGEATSPPAGGSQDRNWATLAHLGSLSVYFGVPFGNILLPLLIWLARKDGSPFVDEHGKESLNFQISFTLYVSMAAVLCLLLVGFLLLPLLFIAHVALVIIAAVRANSGRLYRYPLSIRLVK